MQYHPYLMAALLCHGVWTSAASGDHHLVLSSAAPGQTFYCLDYRDRDGDIEGQFTRVSWEYSRRIRRREKCFWCLKEIFMDALEKFSTHPTQ